MTRIINLLLLTIMFTSVYALEPRQENRSDFLEKFVQILLKQPNIFRRAVEQAKLKKARHLFDKITKHMKPKQLKRWLRHQEDNVENDIGDDPAGKLVEEELKNSLKQKKSALLDHPVVKTEGKNDFLVMRPDILDPMVTVIPNAMYINVEKKCVNWLDDCSLNGIRSRLLRGVRSPYR